MNILLLNPPYRISSSNGYERFFVRAGSRWPYSENKKIAEPSIYRPFPFSLAYAAAVLDRAGYTVEAIDAVALQMTHEQFNAMIAKKAPDVAVIEIAPFSIEEDIRIAATFAARNIVPVAVGPFVPLLFDHFRQRQGFAYCICGEYEITLQLLVDSIGKKSGQLPKGVYRVDGSALPEKMAHTAVIDPLDQLPAPKRDIFPVTERPDNNAYWDVFCQLRPAAQMHASRGCPYRCYFCLWNQVFYQDGNYRVFSAARIVDEMESVVKQYGVREVYFDDDDFTINRKQVRTICAEMLDRGVKVRWSCMGDAINLDEETVALMAKSGCIGIKFGVESANASVLSLVRKPVDLGKVSRLVAWCKKYGIRTHATFTFGLMNETPASMEETLRFAERLDTDSVQFSIATPYPGTAFHQELTQQNRIAEFDWMNYDGSTRCVVEYPGLSADEIERFFAGAFRRWLRRKLLTPAWYIRQVRILARMISSQNISYTLLFMKRLVAKVLQ
jgi:radical SAM superfamily enzyme YgiQ (UPF0313 family)